MVLCRFESTIFERETGSYNGADKNGLHKIVQNIYEALTDSIEHTTTSIAGESHIYLWSFNKVIELISAILASAFISRCIIDVLLFIIRTFKFHGTYTYIVHVHSL